MRHPAGVGFDADQLQSRMVLEDAPEYEQADDVLAAADDRHERVELGTTRLEVIARAREDVERQRQFQLDGGLPERIIDRIVVVGDGRVPRHHHPPESERLDAL